MTQVDDDYLSDSEEDQEYQYSQDDQDDQEDSEDDNAIQYVNEDKPKAKKKSAKSSHNAELEEILYKIPRVTEPLIGPPKKVQSRLDEMALTIQADPNSRQSNEYYNTIHLYMHGYLVNVALKKFPYIRGMQTVDIYQEALIALRFKAIPGFDPTKGMSFLNFAKMCIKRHLITILNASINRLKDQPMNRAISLDSTITDDSDTTFSNIIPDEEDGVDEEVAKREAFNMTKTTLMNNLSDFEKIVLAEYLTNSSYREIAYSIFEYETIKEIGEKKATKAVDNALLRIRSKAIVLLETEDLNFLPMFIK